MAAAEGDAARLRSSYASAVFWVTTFAKVIMIPLYYSTDFDVHRNWMAITSSLPLREWYTEATSQWTLDYPPFFAWFEWLLSFGARFFDPAMLRISAEPYFSGGTLLYQRLTVIASDAVLYWALLLYCRATATHAGPVSMRKGTGLYERRLDEMSILVLAFANPGLLLVDHIHFQYNGFLLGVFILSITAIRQGHDLLGGMLFAVLLNFKHIFLYVAPVYFVYLLRNYCFEEEVGSFQNYQQFEDRFAKRQPRRFSVVNFIRLGLCVILVFALSMGPFFYYGAMPNVMARLFPVHRGLCHAYWAPNVWAIYSALDTGLGALARKLGGEAAAALAASAGTRGLVRDAAFAILPEVRVGHTGLLTIATMAPALLSLWRTPHPKVFHSALVYCSLCSFMLGYHVHEKAILMTTIPLSLCALDDVLSAKLYLFLNTVGTFSLFPLFFTYNEAAVKCALLAFHVYVAYHVLDLGRERVQVDSRISIDRLLHWLERLYLWMIVPLQALCGVLPALLPRFSFLPLMLVSLYCAFGLVYSWRLSWKLHRRRIDLLTSYTDADKDD